MERINNILNNYKYKKYIQSIEKSELNREFCKHDIKHFIDVARISYILVLENGIDIEKEIVYATSLLHDIGRWAQYKDGVPHEEASVILSEEILTQSGFNEYEKHVILSAIRHHRVENAQLNNFNNIFSISDKLSRECYICNASKQCKWSDTRKNYNIIY